MIVSSEAKLPTATVVCVKNVIFVDALTVFGVVDTATVVKPYALA